MTRSSRGAAPEIFAGRPASPWRRREQLIGLAGALPALVVTAGFMLFPVGFALYISFTNTNGIHYRWVGLSNYVSLLSDPVVHGAFATTLKFLLSVPLVVFVALIVSVLLFERVRGWKWFRVIFFIPNVLSTVVVGITFKNLFGYNGVINEVIARLGGARVEFFTNGTLAIIVIIVALIWTGFGYQAVLLLNGLNAIDPTIFEAAELDGAGWWRRLFAITLPSIRRELGFVSIINVIYTFTALFGFLFVMTAGGPGYATTTIDYLVYLKAFSTSNLGPGAALSVLLVAFLVGLTVVQSRFFRIEED